MVRLNPTVDASLEIVQFIGTHELDTSGINTVPQLTAAAGFSLDAANATDITGCPLFKAKDGVWYVGSVEFVVDMAHHEYVAETLVDNNYCECQNCGHLDMEEDLNEIQDMSARVAEGEPEPAGECTKCGALSHVISEERAAEIGHGFIEDTPMCGIDYDVICEIVGQQMVDSELEVRQAIGQYGNTNTWAGISRAALALRAQAVRDEDFRLALIHHVIYRNAVLEVDNA